MKIQPTLSFAALLAALCLQPWAYADVKSAPGKPATASGELVDCFYEQNAGHAACQQFRGPTGKKAITKVTPASDEGRIDNRTDKNPTVSAAPLAPN